MGGNGARFFVLACLVVSFSLIRCDNATSVEELDEDEVAARKLTESVDNLRKLVSGAIKAALPTIMQQASDGNMSISVECQRSLFQSLVALKNFKRWAIYMLDSWGKTLDGILLGSVSAFGNYDQCLDVVATDPKRRRGQPEKVLFTGQYCSLELTPKLPKKPRFYSINKRLDAFKKFENDTEILGDLSNYMQIFYLIPFRIGICVPSLCSEDDVYRMTDSILRRFADVNLMRPRCELKSEPKIEPYQIPTIVMFTILGVVLACGTVVDVVIQYKEKRGEKPKAVSNTAVRTVRCFSVYANFQKLMDVNAGSETLKILHGVRFYSICWIILGHTYYHISYNMLKNLKFTLALFQDMSFNIVTNATLVVDNFFFISGLLMTYVSYDLAKRSGASFSSWQFVIHRIYRFWPMQMAFVGFTMLLPFLGDGPLWKENIDPLVDACRKDWWTNLVFINNFYRSGADGCVSHAWYLSADMQIYLICLLVLVPLVKYPKWGLFLNYIFIAASMLIAGWYNYWRDLPPTMLITKPDKEQNIELMREIYYTPYHHLAPYCIGMLVGHYLHSPLTKKRIHPVLQAVFWILSLVVTSATLFGVHTWNEGGDPGKLVSAVYAAFSRVAWTLGLVWLTWACSTGHGGFITRCLKWQPLIPLSRLTFSVYLVHPYVQRIFYANVTGVIEARNYMAIFIWFGFLVVSYLISLVVCLCIESPFINMGFIIFEKHRDWTHRHSVPEKTAAIGNNRDTEKATKKQNGEVFRINDLKNKREQPESNGDGFINDGFICRL